MEGVQERLRSEKLNTDSMDTNSFLVDWSHKMERRVNSKGRKMWGQCKVFFFFFPFSKGDYYNLFADVLSGSNPRCLLDRMEIDAVPKSSNR